MDRLALSALDWWEEAGVDVLVDETARDWLAPPRRPDPSQADPTQADPLHAGPFQAGALPAGAAPAGIGAAEAGARAQAATPAAPVPRFPADLAAFRARLLADPAIPGRPAARIDAVGDPASGTMVLLDMPEAGDRATRRLLSNDAGALLDRMLGAMGLSRDTVYLAPFSPARPASGSLDAEAIAALLPAVRHHLALAAPRRLLLMGEAPVRALLGLGCNEARGRTHQIEVAGASGPTQAAASMPASVPTVASFPPRFVLQASAPDDLKARRAKVWADLQLFMAL